VKPALIAPVLAAGALALLVAGCAATPRQYQWRPPIPVAAADWEACRARAEGVAERRYDRYVEVEMAGPFGEPLVGILLAPGASHVAEDAYEWEMIRCLGARGYDLRGPAPAER
jgi:hypothetical protein